MASTNSLIVFLIPPEKIVNGGVMSIFSLCKESRALASVHHSKVILCTYIGYPTYHNNDLFNNDEYIYDFDEVVAKFKNVKKLTIHVPELAVIKLNNKLPQYSDYLKGISSLHINILNQNIRYMPSYSDIFALYKYTDHITQTTAHDRYSTQEICNEYSLPLKHLSVFIDPSQYTFTSFEQKKDVIAYSIDKHPMKEKVIQKLKETHPEYELLEIQGVTYEKYKEIATQSKFMITFGEGLDGYFIESTFSGSIPLAVYNEDFFPSKSFEKLPSVYKSYDEMIEKIGTDIDTFNAKATYAAVNKHVFDLLADLYNADRYRNNLKEFYEGMFDYLPDMSIAVKKYGVEIGRTIRTADLAIKELTLSNTELKNQLEQQKSKNEKLTNDLNNILSSHSWRITKPLRSIAKKLK